MSASNEGPYIMVRRRVPEGRIRHDRRIDRYWKSRETGEVVEVRRYLIVQPEQKEVIIFFDPTVEKELSTPFSQFKVDFEPYGNRSDRF